MKILFAALAAVAALVLAAPALAKGPSQASITGPGLNGGGIHLKSGGGDPSAGTPLGNLTEYGGYFPATFGQQPNPMLTRRPSGQLGPRYSVVYKVPGPGGDVATIRQDLYPYATPSPLTYTQRGQTFFDGQKTHGGWFAAPGELKTTLVAAGLPRTAPSASSGDGWLPSWPATAGIAVAAAALGLACVAFATRRRPRPAGA